MRLFRRTCFRSSTVLPWSGACGLLSVSPPQKHHERCTFCRRGGNLRPCDSGSAIDS
jgi:hypothetical protein